MNDLENRKNRIAIFEDTLEFCEREPYLVHAVEHSRKHVSIWNSSLLRTKVQKNQYESICLMEAPEHGVIEEAKKWRDMNPDSHIGIVNFALSWNPGGSVIRGGNGSEEELCRCSTLYPCLNTEYLCNAYYKKNNIADGNISFVNRFVYIPDVICIRENATSPILRKEEWFNTDVISCVMPEWMRQGKNCVIARKDSGTEKVESYSNRMSEQWMSGIYTVAVMQNIDCLIFAV